MKTRTKSKRPQQLYLRTTGGMGISLEGRIDPADLPDDLAEKVQSNLTPRKLSYVVRRKATAFMPGQQEYEVTLFSGAKSEPKRYAFNDQQADPELLDLLDELTSIIIEEKMRRRRAGLKPDRVQAEDDDPPALQKSDFSEAPQPLATTELANDGANDAAHSSNTGLAP